MEKNQKLRMILPIMCIGISLPMCASFKDGSLFPILNETERVSEIQKLTSELAHSEKKAQEETAAVTDKIMYRAQQASTALQKIKINHPRYTTMGVIGGVAALAATACNRIKHISKQEQSNKNNINFENYTTFEQANQAMQEVIIRLQPAVKKDRGHKTKKIVERIATPGLDKILEVAAQALADLSENDLPGGEIMSIYWTKDVQADVKKLSPKTQQFLHKICLDYDCNIMTWAAANERAYQLRQEGYVLDKYGFAHKDGDTISYTCKFQDGARLIKMIELCKEQINQHAQ